MAFPDRRTGFECLRGGRSGTFPSKQNTTANLVKKKTQIHATVREENIYKSVCFLGKYGEHALQYLGTLSNSIYKPRVGEHILQWIWNRPAWPDLLRF